MTKFLFATLILETAAILATPTMSFAETKAPVGKRANMATLQKPQVLAQMPLIMGRRRAIEGNATNISRTFIH